MSTHTQALATALAQPPRCPACGATERHAPTCLRAAGTAKRPEDAASEVMADMIMGHLAGYDIRTNEQLEQLLERRT